MKIAFLLNTSSLFGANRSLLSYVDYLLTQDVSCYFLLPAHGAVEQELEHRELAYKVVDCRPCVWYPGYIGAPFLVNLMRLGEIKQTLQDWGVDIVSTNNSNYDIGMIAAKQLGLRHVWHVREIMESNYQTKYILPRMYKRLRAQSDAVICVSKFIRDYHMQHYPNKNMVARYNPFDVEYYNIERDSFLPGDTYRIINAGAFTDYKRPLDSIMAIGDLVERGITNVHLYLAGDGDEYEARMQAYMDEHHLEPYVEIIHFTPDLRELRRKCDAAVCCSIDEALPRTLVESMLGELLVLGSRSGGIAELIGDHNERGYAYEAGDHKALADQIEYSMHHKEESRQKILTAKEFAIENFEWERNSRKIMQVYADLLGENVGNE